MSPFPQTPCFATALPLRTAHETVPNLHRHRPHHLQAHHRPTARLQPAASSTRHPPSPGPNAGTNNRPEVRSTPGLYLDRKRVEGSVRTGRAHRLKRWTTLGDIDASEDDMLGGETRVDVELVVTKSRGDYRVAGMVQTRMKRVCDRCACEFEADVDGGFEVWLVDDGGERVAERGEFGYEACEEFGGSVAGVDLGSHVRDGVLLGVPTRALCDEGCRGVEGFVDAGLGSVRYGGGRAEEEEVVEEEEGGEERASVELLREMKERLERRES